MPLDITDVSVVLSHSRNEVRAIERILQLLLAPQRLRASGMQARGIFFRVLMARSVRYIPVSLAYDGIEKLRDRVAPELKLIMHRRNLRFHRTRFRLRQANALIWSRRITPARIVARSRIRRSDALVEWASTSRLSQLPSPPTLPIQ